MFVFFTGFFQKPICQGLRPPVYEVENEDSLENDPDYYLVDHIFIRKYFAKGIVRGHGITPLYATVPQAALEDAQLYAMLALADALRVGKAREKNIAVQELKNRIW